MKGRPQLVVWVSCQGGKPRGHRFLSAEITVGRAPTSDVVLTGDDVSDHHAQIITQYDRLIVRDLISETGTYVRGQPIWQPTVVHEKERIRLADYELWITTERAPRYAPSAALDPWAEQTTGEWPRPVWDHSEGRLPAWLDDPLGDVERRMLAAVHANPDDDAPRLVYADWLMEQGDPRGEFIALQCGLHGRDAARRERSDSASVDASALERVRALVDAHAARWLQPLRERIPRRPVVAGDGTVVLVPVSGHHLADSPFRLVRGFLGSPVCLLPEGGDEPRLEGLFRLSPTIYDPLGESLGGPSYSRLYQARVLGAHSSGDERVAVKAPVHSPNRFDDTAYGHEERVMSMELLCNELAVARLVGDCNVARYLGPAYWGLRGDLALVIEWSDGWTLPCFRAYAEHGTHRVAFAAAVVSEVLATLQHIHTARDHRGQPAAIVHRETRPDHVLIEPDGRVLLIDLGWTRSSPDILAYPEVYNRRTALRSDPSATPWHLSYLPPEVVENDAVSPRTDLYSAGVILYEYATGRHPLGSAVGDFHRVRDAIVRQRPPRPALIADLPLELEAVILRATRPDPDERYPDAAAMADELAAAVAAAGLPSGRAFIADVRAEVARQARDRAR